MKNGLLLYEKVSGTIRTKIEWEHPDLKIALSKYNVTKQDYPQLLRELKAFKLISVSNRKVKVLGEGE